MLNRAVLPNSPSTGGGILHESDKVKVVFVTPAAPGYFAVSPCHDEGGAICEASLEPVVAWALDEFGDNHPVLLTDGLNYKNPAILCPDGRVLSYCGEWESLPDWLEEQRAVDLHSDWPKKAKVQHDDLC